MEKELVFGIAVILAVFATLPICFRWPWVGAVFWGWLAFLYPSRLSEGRAFGIHLIWLVAAVTLTGVAVNGAIHRLPRSRELCLLLILWAFCGLTTAVAATVPDRAWAYFGQLTWNLAVTLVVMSLSLDRRKLEALLWVTAVPLGLYALGGTAWLAYTGGVVQLYGPRSSDIWNNNNLGATLVATAPFFVFLGRHLAPWARRGADVLFTATIVAILGTYSRGAALSLALVLAMLAVYRQWRALILTAAGFVVFMLLTTPATWLNRIDTIRTFRQEESASMRMDLWYVAVRLGLDHPLLGAGFCPFRAEVYQHYVPGSAEHHDAHNMFLQVFAEHGFPGLALYAALIASTLATLGRTIRRPAARPGDGWYQDCARMLLIALAAYLLDGMFHVLSYRPFFLGLLVLSIMVDTLARPAPCRRAGI